MKPRVVTVRGLRRTQILAEARSLVAEEGLSALTIGTLEKRLPFSRGVITLAMLDDALDDIDAATRIELQAGDSLEDKIRAVLRTKVRGFLQVIEAARVLVSFWGQLQTDPRTTARNAALFQRYRHQSAGLLREGQRLGVFHPDVDVDAFAALLVAQVLGIVLQALFDPDRIDVDRLVDAATHAVHRGASERPTVVRPPAEVRVQRE
jgi:AcrR family transcriptional regulator